MILVEMMDDIVNLEYLLSLVLINVECRNPKAVVDGGELTRNNTQKKKPHVLQAFRCSVTNAICESISSKIIWNNVNQLRKHDISCGSIFWILY